MIKSLNTHYDVIKKIKQNGFKKIDYLGIDINEIWLNFSLKDGLEFKSKKFKDGKFFNSNIMKRTIEFNKDLLLNSEVFILKNEYFGFDSKKINFFRTKEGLISERFFHEIGIKQGPIQTLLFIQK
ncbi:hypothetical protein, partial [Mycoplasmopsis cricetuli]|uniref:hypothetical protein n=1 Tax=Mycoplasmopsis cricetuli TaxID=171283 RepID=UPI0005656C57